MSREVMFARLKIKIWRKCVMGMDAVFLIGYMRRKMPMCNKVGTAIILELEKGVEWMHST